MTIPMSPISTPIKAKSHSSCMLVSRKAGVGNSGAQPRKCTATAVATTEEMATGIKERARNSNSRSSMATRRPAKGATNVAAMPPAAPAASSTRR